MIPDSILNKLYDILNEFYLDQNLSKVYFVGNRLTGYYRENAPYQFLYADTSLLLPDDEYKIGRIDPVTGVKVGLIRRNATNLFDLDFDLPAYNVGLEKFVSGSKDGILSFWNFKLNKVKPEQISLFFKDKFLYSNNFNITEEDINSLKLLIPENNA